MRAKIEATVGEAIEHFYKKCAARNLSAKTVESYKKRLKTFKEFIEDETLPISSVDKNIVDDYILYLRETGNRNDVSNNSFLHDLRVFLYFCMDEGYIPTFKIKLPKIDKPIKEIYLDNELVKLLRKPNVKTCDFTEYKMWVLSNFLLATGNRISSVIEIKIGDLDFQNALIQVNKAKNRKAQIIPMSTVLSEILYEYLTYRKGETSDFLFCNAYGEKAHQRTYQGMLSRYNTRRGVTKTSAHLYRHTFAKKWILNGGDIFRLQKILGHSDLAMVREYVNMFSNDVAIDFERFNPLDNFDGVNRGNKIKLNRK
jgi:integrase/recombinase XerD